MTEIEEAMWPGYEASSYTILKRVPLIQVSVSDFMLKAKRVMTVAQEAEAATFGEKNR